MSTQTQLWKTAKTVGGELLGISKEVIRQGSDLGQIGQKRWQAWVIQGKLEKSEAELGRYFATQLLSQPDEMLGRADPNIARLLKEIQQMKLEIDVLRMEADQMGETSSTEHSTSGHGFYDREGKLQSVTTNPRDVPYSSL